MIPGRPRLAKEATQEISALITVLHESGQRLEELTAGEVDAVADGKGRAFLLRGPQEQLRDLEAAKQAAILDALPAHIALLDARGLVVAANRSWQLLADAGLPQGLACEVGENYLEVCDGAHTANTSAERIAAGLRAVVSGESQRFWIEYACPAPLEQRWFQLTVTPLVDAGQSGAIVMQLEVSAERQIKEELHASELRFRQVAENIRDVFFLLDADSDRLLYLSPAYEEIWGRSCESAYSNPDAWAAAIHPDDRAATQEKHTRGMAQGTFEYEYRIVRPDGSIRWVQARGFPVRDETGKTVRIAGVTEDITERKKAERRIRRLNRVHAVLSQANALATRVRGRDELFKEMCRIAVEVGEFSLAWIGLIDPQTLQGSVVARCGGEPGALDAAGLTLCEGPLDGERPANRALRLLQPVICNDILTDHCVDPVRDELLSGGHRSAGYFPLTLAGRTRAVIALFSTEPGAFDEEERRLLLDLASDIAYALDHLEKQERLDYLAYYDALTGLANRTLFLDRLGLFLSTAVSGKHKLAVLLIDLERFKNINDGLGRPAGDALLRLVADWLTHNLGSANTLARVGADQFAAILPIVRQESDVTDVLSGLIAALLRHPFRLNDAVFRIGAKVGVTVFPDDAGTADTLLMNAEAALKKAKSRGDRYLFYTHNMTEQVAGKLTLENQLRQALDNGEFVLHYQPKISFSSGDLTGAEALIRWNDPRTGLVPPGRFIPVLEETGLIYDVGRWALRQAIDDYLRWGRMGLAALRVAVNVSPLQVRHRDFIVEVERAIAVDPVAAAGLELELTESLIMEDIRNSITSLAAIREMGVQIAIDDFGTGFSSLSYLAKLPVDSLKIDRSFVVDMTIAPEGLSLVSTIINLAHSMKLIVVAEGVETEEQARLLRLLNCDEMQGYLLGRPAASDVFEKKYLTARACT